MNNNDNKIYPELLTYIEPLWRKAVYENRIVSDIANVFAYQYRLSPEIARNIYPELAQRQWNVSNLTPLEIHRRLQAEGLLVDSDTVRQSALKILNGNDITVDDIYNLQLAALHTNLRKLYNTFEQQQKTAEMYMQYRIYDDKTLTSSDEVILGRRIIGNVDDILSFDTFMSYLRSATSAAEMQSYIDERREIIKDYLHYQWINGIKTIKEFKAANKTTNVFTEFLRGLARPAAEVLSLNPDWRAITEKWFQEGWLRSPDELTTPQYIASIAGNTTGWLAMTALAGVATKAFITTCLPQLPAAAETLATSISASGRAGTAAVQFCKGLANTWQGGWLIALVEGNNAYQAALDRGIDKDTAAAIGATVGFINGSLEGLQLDRVIKFGRGATGESVRRFVAQKTFKQLLTEIPKKTAAATADTILFMANGGIQEALQTDAHLVVPFLFTGYYPTDPITGKPDWTGMLKETNYAFWGGVIGQGFAGAIARGYTTLQIARWKHYHTLGVMTHEGISDWHTARMITDEVYDRLRSEPASEYASIMAETLQKYRAINDKAILDEIEKDIPVMPLDAQQREFYQAFLDKPQKPEAISKKLYKSAKDFFEYHFETISSRLKAIDPSGGLTAQFRTKLIFPYYELRTKWLSGILPFLNSVNQADMTDADRTLLTAAIFNADGNTITSIVQKYGLTQQYQLFRQTMDVIAERLKKIKGDEFNPIEAFFHLIVKDYTGLRTYLSQNFSEQWSIIKDAIEAEKVKKNRELTESEELMIIHGILRGFPQNRIYLSEPSAMKHRQVIAVYPEMLKFYERWDLAQIQYVEEVARTVAVWEFLGKEPIEIRQLRRRIPQLNARLEKLIAQHSELSQKIASDEVVTDTEEFMKLQNKLIKLGKRVLQVKKELQDTQTLFEATKDKHTLENSINSYVKSLVDTATISAEHEFTLRQILQDLIQPAKTGKIIDRMQRFTYMLVLSQFHQAIKQLSEISLSAIINPKSAISNTVKAILRKTPVSLQDIYVTNPALEYPFDIYGKFAQKLMWFLTGADALGKNVLINTVLDDYIQTLERDGEEVLRRRLQPLLGSAELIDEALSDLKAKRYDGDGIKALLFVELSERQPVSALEVPQAYLHNPTMRLLYMFKTFTIKRLNFIRETAIRSLSGSEKDRKKAIAALAQTVLYLYLADVGIDVIIDFLYGRPLKISEALLDNILQNTLILNRYLAQRIKREGFATAFMHNIIPPFALNRPLDAMCKDILYLLHSKEYRRRYYKVQGFETPRTIPIAGEAYYWLFGKGRQKIKLEQQRQKGKGKI